MNNDQALVSYLMLATAGFMMHMPAVFWLASVGGVFCAVVGIIRLFVPTESRS